MTRILVVEDEESFSDALSFMLRKEGFSVSVATTGPLALEMFDREPVDLVLLDLMLPGMSGTDVCRTIRARSRVPIIMVTAKDSEIDKVLGLELGADDYVTKPFSSRELVARIRAVLRRTAQDSSVAPTVIDVGSLHVDLRSRVVEFDGVPVALTPKEYDLLVCLASDAGAVKTREQLMREVWDENWWGSTKTLDVHVASLRRKLAADAIETVRSVGYRYTAPPGESS